jgi:small redox-active disulfide protein 2
LGIGHWDEDEYFLFPKAPSPMPGSENPVKIQILGSGCSKCRQLAANAEAAARSLGLNVPVEHVTDIAQIVAAGVMVTPALVIDGKVVSTGRVLDAEAIKEKLHP